MLALNDYDKMDSVLALYKATASLKDKAGVVYFFKYRIKKTDDWKIGMSGLQPVNEESLSSNEELTVLTDKKFKEYEPMEEQFMLQLKKLLFSYHKSARNFFVEDTNNNYRANDYED